MIKIFYRTELKRNKTPEGVVKNPKIAWAKWYFSKNLYHGNPWRHKEGILVATSSRSRRLDSVVKPFRPQTRKAKRSFRSNNGPWCFRCPVRYTFSLTIEKKTNCFFPLFVCSSIFILFYWLLLVTLLLASSATNSSELS